MKYLWNCIHYIPTLSYGNKNSHEEKVDRVEKHFLFIDRKCWETLLGNHIINWTYNFLKHALLMM